MERYEAGDYAGVGFMFGAEPGGFVGVDLDGCRDPDTATVSDWAKEIILKLDSYAEVSPSKSGVKIFVRGRSPFDSGKNLKLDHLGEYGGKKAGIEIYDHGRYFAVTGMRVKGPHTCKERQTQLDWLKGKFWPDAVPVKGGDFYGEDSVLERARKYVAKCPPAISGQNGSGAAFHVACLMVLGFGLSYDSALVLMRRWNQSCNPPWSERELAHKIADAAKQSGPRNYLRNVGPQNWSSVKIPDYAEPEDRPKSTSTTLSAAANKYLDHLVAAGGQQFVELGFPDLECALGGGVELGELAIIAARPSHGKSMLGLQFIHHWSDIRLPSLLVSEEMGELSIGKRVLQYLSPIPQEHWFDQADKFAQQAENFFKERSECHLTQNCRTVEAVTEEINRHVGENGIQACVVDYIQLLQSKGKDRYESITNVSIALRRSGQQTQNPSSCSGPAFPRNRETPAFRAADERPEGQRADRAGRGCRSFPGVAVETGQLAATQTISGLRRKEP